MHVVLNRNYYMMTSLDDPDLKNIVFLSMLALGMSNNKNTRFFKSGTSPDIIMYSNFYSKQSVLLVNIFSSNYLGRNFLSYVS